MYINGLNLLLCYTFLLGFVVKVEQLFNFTANCNWSIALRIKKLSLESLNLNGVYEVL